MVQVAAAAADKAAAHQRKMTDYVDRQVPPGGAGELPSGPCGPAALAGRSAAAQQPGGGATAAAATIGESSSGSGTGGVSATEQVVNQLLQKARQEQAAGPVLQAVEILQKALDDDNGSSGEKEMASL